MSTRGGVSMATSKRGRDKLFDKAALQLAVVKSCSAEQAQTLYKMNTAYNTARAVFMRSVRKKMNDVQVFEALCEGACQQMQHAACTELRHLDASEDVSYTLQLYVHNMRQMQRCEGPACTLAETMHQAATVRARCLARTEASCEKVCLGLQYCDFVGNYTTLSKLIALAEGTPEKRIHLSERVFEQHRSYREMMREELFVGALLMYAQFRKARTQERLAVGMCVFMKQGLSLSNKPAASPARQLDALHKALDWRFMDTVEQRETKLRRETLLLHRLRVTTHYAAVTKKENDQILMQIRVIEEGLDA